MSRRVSLEACKHSGVSKALDVPHRCMENHSSIDGEEAILVETVSLPPWVLLLEYVVQETGYSTQSAKRQCSQGTYRGRFPSMWTVEELWNWCLLLFQ